MELPLVQVDAFVDPQGAAFTGNPAAVMALPHWLPDRVLAGIAEENNLSETAFLVDEAHGSRLRWFTPTVEVDLCGHATLASGYVRLQDGADRVAFETRSGTLAVHRCGDDYGLDLPAIPPVVTDPDPALLAALGNAPRTLYRVKSVHNAAYFLALYEDQASIEALAPDTRALGAVHRANVICTAPGDACDFVSRFFAPASGVDEDPVTGSAHATLAPFWAARLGKTELSARQVSKRGGWLRCEVRGDRVWLWGRCHRYLDGTVRLPDGLR